MRSRAVWWERGGLGGAGASVKEVGRPALAAFSSVAEQFAGASGGCEGGGGGWVNYKVKPTQFITIIRTTVKKTIIISYLIEYIFTNFTANYWVKHEQKLSTFS